MTTAIDTSFEAAVEALMSPLHQSRGKQAIEEAAARRTKTVTDMRYYWNQIAALPPTGSNSSSNNLLPLMIHITGTKGKGSTACLSECILRQQGLSTGLFTSPHLVNICERIRLDGLPVHPDVFAKAYWTIRTCFETTTTTAVGDDPISVNDDPPPTYPGYFRMLTLMAYFIFQQARVDCSIVEVGMGGRYDATNFCNATELTTVRGVTLLDLDHVRILGDTLEKIAWEKGGIFANDKATSNRKQLSPRPASMPGPKNDNDGSDDGDGREKVVMQPEVWQEACFFVLSSNTPGVLRMFQSCAQIEGQGGQLVVVDATGTELKSQLLLQQQTLGLAGEHQYGNATLAMAMCRRILKLRNHQFSTAQALQALAEASWPARCQTVPHAPLTLRLDGAHTIHSLTATMEWFQTQTQTSSSSSSLAGNNKACHFLMFNCSHERNPLELLSILAQTACPFQHVYFCTSDFGKPSPLAMPTAAELLQQAGIAPLPADVMMGSSNTATTTPTWQETLAILWKHLPNNNNNKSHNGEVTFNVTAQQAMDDILSKSEMENPEVLVTGSLYLVGSVLTAIGWSEESSRSDIIFPQPN
jgi:folylpolyglutamate synthase